MQKMQKNMKKNNKSEIKLIEKKGSIGIKKVEYRNIEDIKE